MRAELLQLTSLYVGLAVLGMILALALVLWRLNRRAKRQWEADLAEHVARVQERANARQMTDRIPLAAIRKRLARNEDNPSDTTDVPDDTRHGRHALPEEGTRRNPPVPSHRAPEIPAQAGPGVARSPRGGTHVPHRA